MRCRPAVAAMVCLVALLFDAPPASAHQWTEPNTWANGHVIGLNQINQGNIVSLWQMMLSARYRKSRYDPYSPPVTGVFSSTTDNYTKVWQAEHSIAADGVVGRETWNAARFFHVKSSPYESGGWKFFKYRDTGYPGLVDLPFSTVYGTWFTNGCGGSPYDIQSIDHPAVSIVNPNCD